LKLVEKLIETQLGGTVEIKRDGGTEFVIEFQRS
jgi:two-component sensor histidine kinase